MKKSISRSAAVLSLLFILTAGEASALPATSTRDSIINSLRTVSAPPKESKAAPPAVQTTKKPPDRTRRSISAKKTSKKKKPARRHISAKERARIRAKAAAKATKAAGAADALRAQLLRGKENEAAVVASCRGTAEICGDGIDQDCNGSDLACGSAPSNPNGGPASSPQSADCEAVNGGRCFYISGERGNDGNPGSLGAPWKTYRNIITYYDPKDRPAGWKSLGAGDVVYFLNGLYTDSYRYDQVTRGFFLRNVRGTSAAPVIVKAYRSEKPKFRATAAAATIEIHQTDHIILDGLEVDGAHGAGVRVGESKNAVLRNLWVRNTFGTDDNNIAGVYITDSNGVRLHNSVVNDNYDRSNSSNGGVKSENSRNVVLFRGGNARIDHNNIYHTPSIDDPVRGGACVAYKHSQNIPGAIFEVDHNTFSNCSFTSVGTGTYNSFIHHNLTLNSAPILIANFGGETHQQNIAIERNTIIGGGAFSVYPDLTFGPFGPVFFRGNIVIDTLPYGFDHRGIIRIAPYGGDDLYDKVVRQDAVQVNENCYFNAGFAPMFSLFAANGGGAGSQGGLFDFAAWQARGFDNSSAVANPGLNLSFTPTNGLCGARGWVS
jgi:hypothetical protein